MVVELKHMPSKRPRTTQHSDEEEVADNRRVCRQCKRAGRKQRTSLFYCQDCKNICGHDVFVLSMEMVVAAPWTMVVGRHGMQKWGTVVPNHNLT